MKYILSIALLCCFSTFALSQEHSHAPDSVLTSLKMGNSEFVAGKFDVHGVDPQLRNELSKGQHPGAVVLTCADSRVSPELIFNKGLGDLFVIRVAGNVTNDDIIASIEYAVEHLHSSLVVVMGHTNCGAIGAAVSDLQDPSAKIDNHVRSLTDKIQTAIRAENLNESDLSRKALLSNVMYNVNLLSESRPVLAEAVKHGEIKIVGAVYDLATGKVNWL